MKLLKHYGLALLSVFFAFAYANAQSGSIKVGSLTGNVTVINGSGSSVTATSDYIFTPPATIVTDGDSSILLYLSNGAVLEIKPGSRVEITHFSQEPFETVDSDPFRPLQPEQSSSQVSVRVVSGSVAANVSGLNSGSTFLVSTPTSDIQVNNALAVVSYDPATANTQVTNVSGDGSVVYESSTPGSEPASVPSGQTLAAPGQIDQATGTATTSGQPTVSTATSGEIQAGQQAGNPPAQTTTTPGQTNTPPAAPSTTPQTDLPDLIDPTTTEPA